MSRVSCLVSRHLQSLIVICAALDGQLKHEDTNLASSTLIHDPTQKENLGIIVQYKVKVRVESSPDHITLLLSGQAVPGTPGGGTGGGAPLHLDASQGLIWRPITATHPFTFQPEPEPERKNSLSEKKSSSSSPNQNGDSNTAPTDVPGNDLIP